MESAFESAGPRGCRALTRPKILIRRCKREVSREAGVDEEAGQGGEKRGVERGQIGSCCAELALGRSGVFIHPAPKHDAGGGGGGEEQV